jgi:hypothetical protein
MRLRNKTVVQLPDCAHTIPLVGNFLTMLYTYAYIYNAFVLLQILVILLMLYYWFLFFIKSTLLCSFVHVNLSCDWSYLCCAQILFTQPLFTSFVFASLMFVTWQSQLQLEIWTNCNCSAFIPTSFLNQS